MTNWHTNDISQILSEFNSSMEEGLDSVQVTERLSQYGFNELIERGGRSALQILWKQLTTSMVLILIAAVIVETFLGEIRNALAILFVIGLFTLPGFIQAYRAEKAVAALKKMPVSNVRVVRDGELKELSARQIVPGDIIQIETGNIIPADLRLLEAVNLRIHEASLTGKSEDIAKHTAALSGDDLPLSDRRNMAYTGTHVTQGRGLALVTATAMQTELGKIADLIQHVKQESTPLQRNIHSLGKTLAQIGGGIAAAIFILGILRGEEFQQMLLAGVSVAIAIVPESLPAIILIALSVGADRMLELNVLIRKLPAVETLGSVTVICSDKTGTLTENRMTVVMLDVADHALDLTEEIERDGSLRTTRGLGTPIQSSLSLAAIGGALCNDAKLIDIGDDRYHTLGDPTEGALVVAAAKMGYWKSSLDSSFPRTAILPFDSERKRMTTVHHLEKYDPTVLAGLEVGTHRYIAFTKGSVDGLLDVTTRVWAEGKHQVLDAGWRSKIEAMNEQLTKKGMRVLGVGFHLMNSIPQIIETDLEQNLTLVGLFGMVDPPRNDVKDAVAECRAAGIRPVMITGDNPLTAIEIARQLGIVSFAPAAVPGGETTIVKALTGNEIEDLTFNELKAVVDEVNVFASVAPEHKLRIVQALQEKGHIVSITGDNVNDAPALRKADIGVAMGISGTEVSKEASDVVLLDDNFATIVTAVKEGRAISDTIYKFIRFSLAGNIGKASVLLLTPFLNNTIALLPLQLLWLNLVVDGLLGIGILAEKSEANNLTRQNHSTNIFGIQTVWNGIWIGILALGIGAWYYFTDRPEWQTMIFTSFVFIQIFQSLASRVNKYINPLLTGMMLLVIALQLMVLYLPPLTEFFEVVPLNCIDLLISICTGFIVFIGKKLISTEPAS